MKQWLKSHGIRMLSGLCCVAVLSVGLMPDSLAASSRKEAQTQSANSRKKQKAAPNSSKTHLSSADKKRSANSLKAQPKKKQAVNTKKSASPKTKSSLQSRSTSARTAATVPARPSFGQLSGLHQVDDPLDLKSSVALIIDQDTHEVLLEKNDRAVLPIASITKLMTGLLITEAELPLDEFITITEEDVDTEKGTRSRLAIGTTLTRGELLHLALMSSENRAAHALGRTYPGGMQLFVQRMNEKARSLGMKDTRYVEPTGLSSRNQSSARDLARLVNVASRHTLLRELSTSQGYEVAVGQRQLQFNNTNRLVKNPLWDIGLQKTGYISEAGQCLVMQASIAGRKLIMVFLDSTGKLSRLADAERVRHWLERSHANALSALGETNVQ